MYYSKQECLGFSPAILTSVLPAVTSLIPGIGDEQKKQQQQQQAQQFQQAQQLAQLQVQQALAAERARQEEQRRREAEKSRNMLYVGLGAAALLGFGGILYATKR